MAQAAVKREANAPWNDPQAVPLIRFEGISKRFGDFTAVEHVDLAIHKGEFFSLLGASGCGKTTLLRMLAGFETPTTGRILIDGQDVTAVPPYERPVNMMFQSYALFPHMSVADNIAFGLKQDGLPKAVIRDKVAASLDLVQMSRFSGRKPHQLSGGQRQRVALARCLAKEPKVVLLDEPLAALDKKLREATQLELVNIQDRVGITFVMVTHDQGEAMTMSSRIGVMNAGRIEQVGSPVEIYEYPGTRFVADFIGAANMFEGTAKGGEGAVSVTCPELEHDLAVQGAPKLAAGAAVTVMVRPEKMGIGRDKPQSGQNWAEGVVSDIAYLGDVSIYHVRLASGRKVQALRTNLHHGEDSRLTWDDPVFLAWHPADSLVLTK
ncbi:Putrescine transport ATP-binding protein PotG [Paramagnetospirillum magnetotacticum MS-1]|uniref:Spermidine/putrescine import ATP-binding protein PotA n=1 Tax=Paramagnetospirillum magnetotacticum MS-1 TaxID=272627 RepID=A0A0C2V1U9_PARME|nr:ABC transporter ATP-binding protein [Paramagnetospirillum magnetotacticum]KIL99061.1 Putrescine transport ATP-binding protein PotG [Paramagnetospirillum magnetotacticum MS-1]